MRVLGIDTSLRSTGISVIERRGSRLVLVAHETVRIAADRPHSDCLRRIVERLGCVIAETEPEAAVMEGIFYARNPRTAVVLGQARGAAMVACIQRDLSVYEYAPRRVKQAVCGAGDAPKEQVARMMATLLGLARPLAEDESDAAALAVCHLHQAKGLAGLAPKPL